MSSLAKIAEAVEVLRSKYGMPLGSAAAAVLDIARIELALDEFMECVRYLNTRRTGSTILELDSEAAVQDAVYLMLRPWVRDLTPESPSERVGNRYAIRDFVSESARAIIEAKFIRDKAHGKSVAKELHDDIENYRHHRVCDNLIFFIYDPNANIPDRGALQRQIETDRVYGGKSFRCRLIVKP